MSNIELYHGDCLEIMDVLIAMGVKVDAIITDPPYGTTACKWDSVIPFEPMWACLNQLIKDNGAIALFGSEPFSSALRMSNIKNFKYDWVWNKKSAANILVAKYQPLKICEYISVFCKSTPNYYPIMTTSNRDLVKEKPCEKKTDMFSGIKSGKFVKTETNKKGTERYPKNLIEFSNANRKNHLHPTQKPVALMEYLIKTYTNEGDTVLDFTMGSGTTGVACKRLNRNFIGIELDDNYFNIAKERINNEAKPTT